MAWERWQEWYEDMCEQKWALERALYRMRHRAQTKAWFSYRLFYQDALNMLRAQAHCAMIADWYGVTHGVAGLHDALGYLRLYAKAKSPN